MFSVPGLAHFMAVQVERQELFVGFDAFVSAWAPEFGALALSDRLCDVEIDLAVADDLQRGDRVRADRLLDLATGGRPGSQGGVTGIDSSPDGPRDMTRAGAAGP